jgi:hypothetical protein
MQHLIRVINMCVICCDYGHYTTFCTQEVREQVLSLPAGYY